MKITERKVVTVEMEAFEYGMLIDLLEAAKRVKSKKYPFMNNMASSLLTAISNSPNLEEEMGATS